MLNFKDLFDSNIIIVKVVIIIFLRNDRNFRMGSFLFWVYIL